MVEPTFHWMKNYLLTNNRCLKLVIATFIVTILLCFYFYRLSAATAFRVTFYFEPEPNLVRIIHQSWKTLQLPSTFANISASWVQCFPTWRYILWSDQANEDFISTHYPWFLATYKSLPFSINRADVVRYFYMYHFGGIYADMDADCLQSFEHILEPFKRGIVFGAMVHSNLTFGKNWFIQNSLIYSNRKHPYWMYLIDRILQTAKNNPHLTFVEALTGPLIMMETLTEYMRMSGYKHDIQIYPPEYFNPFSWDEYNRNATNICHTLNRMNKTARMECRRFYLAKKSYVLQYHTQSWRDGETLS